MIRFLIALLLLVGISLPSEAGVLVLDGEYQLRNVFVLNSQTAAGVGFCVYEVEVNGEITTDETNSDAFEIDLSQYGFELGDAVEVRIKHKDGCEPRVLNPEALEPLPTFEIKEMTVSNDGLLEWSTINEQGSLAFVVQQFKWNKWVSLGEVKGVGTSNENQYQFKLVPVSGENRVRVIQKSFNGKVRASNEVSFENSKPEVTYDYDKKREKITFSEDTAFEIYNRYGQIAKRGFGRTVSVSNLRKSTYYLTFDSSMDEFIKK